MSDFFEKNSESLDNFLKISLLPGAREDYVQGGGGNTSCKFDDKLMAIKASGYRLEQIERDNAYAVLDYAKVKGFYLDNEPGDFDDVEAEGSAIAKSSVQDIDGLPKLRPSVEAGFHSLLSKYVLHTHPIYANLVTCSAEGRELVKEILKDYRHSYGYVDYIDPGAKLTFAIRDEQKKVFEETGKLPAVIFMQNHGFIVTHDDADLCLKIHDEVNDMIARAFGISKDDFPHTALREVSSGEDDKVLFVSNTPYLQEIALNPKYDEDYFCKDSLYPDQLVFLSGNLVFVDDELPENLVDWAKGKCTIYRKSGDIVYSCGRQEALTIEQTLLAVSFIRNMIEETGRTVIFMSDAGKDFISGWESEKYRKSLVEGDE